MGNGLESWRWIWQYATPVALLAFAATMIVSNEVGASLGAAALGAAATAVLVWVRRPDAQTGEDGLDAEAGWQAVAGELRRSRRHQRPFALLAVREAGDAARDLRPLLRTSDHAWVDAGTTYVLLSECDAAQASGFISRARSGVAGTLDADKFSVAVFPTDGITLGALLEALDGGVGLVPEASVHTRQLT